MQLQRLGCILSVPDKAAHYAETLECRVEDWEPELGICRETEHDQRTAGAEVVACLFTYCEPGLESLPKGRASPGCMLILMLPRRLQHAVRDRLLPP